MMQHFDSFVHIVKEAFSKVKNSLSHNLGWKVFSLILAIITWFAVINITNPKEIWPFSIRLTLADLEQLTESKNVVVKNQDELESTTVTVKVRGNRLDLEQLNKNRNGISASANLGVIYDFSLEGTVQAPIDISFPTLSGVSSDAFEVVAISPKYAQIALEGIVTEERPVKVVTSGDVAEGYVALTPEATPDTVQLRGPSSKLKDIESVVVESGLNGETHDISYTLSPKLLDRDGNIVDGVECFTQHVDVLIKVNKYKKLPVNASYVGAPAAGYKVTGIDWTPRNLEIVGNEEDVNSFNSISLPAVNVAGLTQTNTASFDIRSLDILPENVSIKNGTPNTVTVTVTIEQEVQKTIALDTTAIGATTGYSYSITPSSIDIAVQGAASLVNRFTAAQVRASVNLRNLSSGQYTVPVEIILPTGLTLVSPQPVVTVTISQAATSNGNSPQTPDDAQQEADTAASQEETTTPDAQSPAEGTDQDDTAPSGDASDSGEGDSAEAAEPEPPAVEDTSSAAEDNPKADSGENSEVPSAADSAGGE